MKLAPLPRHTTSIVDKHEAATRPYFFTAPAHGSHQRPAAAHNPPTPPIGGMATTQPFIDREAVLC